MDSRRFPGAGFQYREADDAGLVAADRSHPGLALFDGNGLHKVGIQDLIPVSIAVKQKERPPWQRLLLLHGHQRGRIVQVVVAGAGRRLVDLVHGLDPGQLQAQGLGGVQH